MGLHDLKGDYDKSHGVPILRTMDDAMIPSGPDRLQCPACGMDVPADNATAGQPIRCPHCQAAIPRAVMPRRDLRRMAGRRVVLIGLILIAIFTGILIAIAVISHRTHEARLKSPRSKVQGPNSKVKTGRVRV